MKFIRDIISEKRAQAEGGAVVSQDSRDLSELINRRLDAAFESKPEPRVDSNGSDFQSHSRPPLPNSLFAEDDDDGNAPLDKDDPYIREILNPSLTGDEMKFEDEQDDDFEDDLDDDAYETDLLARESEEPGEEYWSDDAEEDFAEDDAVSAEEGVRGLLYAEAEAEQEEEVLEAEEDFADAADYADSEDFADTEDFDDSEDYAEDEAWEDEDALAEAEFADSDEDYAEPEEMAFDDVAPAGDPIADRAPEPAARNEGERESGTMNGGWTGAMPRFSAQAPESEQEMPQATARPSQPAYEAPVEAAVSAPQPASERSPEPERPATAQPVDVPAPAIGRATRRAGRVKTRLLGFNGPQAQTADPFAGTSAPATERTNATHTEFPVGWLVVVKGPGRGAAFTLFAGVAQIGRDQEQTVPLDFGDNSISRENHAAIAYDGEQRKFYLGHGGKANLVRRNDRPVLSTEELNSGDLIRIGETTLRFVALCGEGFDWTGQREGGMQHASVG